MHIVDSHVSDRAPSLREAVIICLWLLIWASANLAFFSSRQWILVTLGVLLLLATWYVSNLDVSKRISLQPIAWRQAGLSMLAGIAFFGVAWFISVTKSLPVFGHVPAAASAWAVLIAPVNEEMVFRGVLYQFLVNRLRSIRIVDPVAVVITSILFGLAHGRSSVFLLLTILAGGMYGIARWRTKSVLSSIVCHIAYNSVSLLGFGR